MPLHRNRNASTPQSQCLYTTIAVSLRRKGTAIFYLAFIAFSFVKIDILFCCFDNNNYLCHIYQSSFSIKTRIKATIADNHPCLAHYPLEQGLIQ